MKIKDITNYDVTEDAKITNVDPTKKTVTYSDPTTNITTTVPDTMVKPGEGGGVAVDTKAVGQAGAGEAPKVAVGASVKDVATTEGSDVPYFVDTAMGKPVAKTTPHPTPIVPAKWDVPTPDQLEKIQAQGFRKVTLQANHQTFTGFEGGGKIYVGAKDFQVLSSNKPVQEKHDDTIAAGGGDVGGDPTDQFIDQVRDKKWERYPRNHTTNSPLSESDELYKWLTIAGLK